MVGILLLRPGFNPWCLKVRFVVDEETLKQNFTRIIRCFCAASFSHRLILIYCTMRCAIAVTKQHIILPSVLS
jgi:hypothetical protein